MDLQDVQELWRLDMTELDVSDLNRPQWSLSYLILRLLIGRNLLFFRLDAILKELEEFNFQFSQAVNIVHFKVINLYSET